MLLFACWATLLALFFATPASWLATSCCWPRLLGSTSLLRCSVRRFWSSASSRPLLATSDLASSFCCWNSCFFC